MVPWEDVDPELLQLKQIHDKYITQGKGHNQPDAVAEITEGDRITGGYIRVRQPRVDER